MSHSPAETSPTLPCHVCGYDLRAHPADGACPECNTPVADSIRLAAIPLRPAWRDADPRWRRRMLAGIWVLAFVPLVDALNAYDVSGRVAVPALFEVAAATRPLNDTFLFSTRLYPPLVFCTGVVLLFAKERNRRPAPLDWTRRWGVLSTYVVLLLTAASILFISALVLTGISALFLCMPPKYQPPLTDFFATISTAYLRYGPSPNYIAPSVAVAFSSLAMLFACVPLYDALRSSGPKRLAALCLAPLILAVPFHLSLAARYALGFWTVSVNDLAHYESFFAPRLLFQQLRSAPGGLPLAAYVSPDFWLETAKCLSTLAIAIWLTLAQLAARRRNRIELSTETQRHGGGNAEKNSCV